MDESSTSGSSLAVGEVARNKDGAYVGGEKHVIHEPPKALGGAGFNSKASTRARIGRQLVASPRDCLVFLVSKLADFMDLGTDSVVKHGVAGRTLVPPPPNRI